MSAPRVWREVYATELVPWLAGKTIASAEDHFDSTTQHFTDGTALRIAVEEGFDYSEYTSEPSRVVFEVSEP